MQKLTLASVGGLADTRLSQAAVLKTVVFRIKGFSCITCAIGLETLLRQKKGVLNANASYTKSNVRIQFYTFVVTEIQIRQYIEEMGFAVVEEQLAT